MLQKLIIENIALIDYLELNFSKGMAAITGETGAGKSIVVNALSLVLGERAEKDYIRHGFNFGRVEAHFNLDKIPPEIKKDFEIYFNENSLQIVREISKNGRSKIKVNDKTITLAELKELTSPLAEILSQHANQQLMDETYHISFLDNFADLNNLKEEVSDKYHLWHNKNSELKKIRDKRDFLLNESDLLNFQKKEIIDANITVGEEEDLTAEKKKLDSVRTLMSSANLIKDVFDNEENSIRTMLELATKELEKMVQSDPTLSKQQEELTDISYRLSDLSSLIESYGESLVDDPARIEEINIRLDEIYKLKKKYGGSEQSILDALQQIKEKLSRQPENIDEYIEQLEKETNELFSSYSETALALSETRIKAAAFLEKQVIKELNDLAIENCQFEFEFIYEDDPNGVPLEERTVKATPEGLETGRILFSANPGEPLKSLVKTASGGEISRVLLALKSAEMKNQKLARSLMVFDEVDAGIGGQTANEVARKLKKLSTQNQLIVITHLHQIAREADHHFVVKKKNDKERRVVIDVNKLDPKSRDLELKRMIALPE